MILKMERVLRPIRIHTLPDDLGIGGYQYPQRSKQARGVLRVREQPQVVAEHQERIEGAHFSHL